MGCTQFEIDKLEKIIKDYKPNNVIELGSQTNYTTSNQSKPPFMSGYYEGKGLMYSCIDLAGDNNAYKYDLSSVISVARQYDLVTDAGTSEHCVKMDGYVSIPFHEGHINSIYPKGQPTKEQIELGYYNCWLNKHNLLKVGGIMFNVNPLTGNWENHGYSYLGSYFYEHFAKVAGYEIIESGTHAACGNTTDGWNVYSVLKKVSDLFPDFETFKTLPIYGK